jgi:hypothetical protein
MARTNYSQDFVQPPRREGVLSRREWSLRATEFAARGSDLPQTKLLPLDVGNIRSAQRQREKLRQYIADNLSNEALAKAYGVHYRTIEKVLSRETASHIA